MGGPFTPTWFRVSVVPDAMTAPPRFEARLLVKVQPVMLVAGFCEKTAPPLLFVAWLPSKCTCGGREARREAWEGVCERDSEGMVVGGDPTHQHNTRAFRCNGQPRVFTYAGHCE
jgi:hypothetical protein